MTEVFFYVGQGTVVRQRTTLDTFWSLSQTQKGTWTMSMKVRMYCNKEKFVESLRKTLEELRKHEDVSDVSLMEAKLQDLADLIGLHSPPEVMVEYEL